MVCGPRVDRIYTNLQYNAYGRQPYDTIVHFALRARKCAEFYTIFDQKLGFKPQNLLRGIPYPTGPQHNHRDLSQVILLVRRSLHGVHLVGIV